MSLQLPQQAAPLTSHAAPSLLFLVAGAGRPCGPEGLHRAARPAALRLQQQRWVGRDALVVRGSGPALRRGQRRTYAASPPLMPAAHFSLKTAIVNAQAWWM